MSEVFLPRWPYLAKVDMVRASPCPEPPASRWRPKKNPAPCRSRVEFDFKLVVLAEAAERGLDLQQDASECSVEPIALVVGDGGGSGP